MNWAAFEQSLFDEVRAALADIAPKAAGAETVLAFCLDCNSDDGTITASLNTREGLARTVARYRRSPAFVQKSEAELSVELGESIGDFSHCNFAPKLFVDHKEYSKHMQQIESEKDEYPTFDLYLERVSKEHALFMAAVARVIIRLQNETCFKALNRSTDFVSFCIDHDEGLTEGLTRIKRARDAK